MGVTVAIPAVLILAILWFVLNRQVATSIRPGFDSSTASRRRRWFGVLIFAPLILSAALLPVGHSVSLSIFLAWFVGVVATLGWIRVRAGKTG